MSRIENRGSQLIERRMRWEGRVMFPSEGRGYSMTSYYVHRIRFSAGLKYIATDLYFK